MGGAEVIGAEVFFKRGRTVFSKGPKCLQRGPKCLFMRDRRVLTRTEVSFRKEAEGTEVVGTEVAGPKCPIPDLPKTDGCSFGNQCIPLTYIILIAFVGKQIIFTL